MAYTKRPIRLKDKERSELERLSSDPSLPQSTQRAASAILLMDQGLTGVEIARRTRFSQMHISHLRHRFWQKGLAGLPTRRRPARSADKPKIPVWPQGRPVALQHHERGRLQRLCENLKTPRHIRRRSRALILMSDGARNSEVAREVGYTIEYVSRLRRLFAREGMRVLAVRKKSPGRE